MPPEPVTSVLSPHSVILWLGDLNYRIEELDVETVKKLIEEKAFQTLYAYDQVQMAACAFEGSCPRTVRAQEGLGSQPLPPRLGGFPRGADGRRSSSQLPSLVHGCPPATTGSSLEVPHTPGGQERACSLSQSLSLSLTPYLQCSFIHSFHPSWS